MNQVGLRFMLKSGAFMDAPMTDHDAQTILRKWASRDYHVRKQVTIDGVVPGGAWSVQVEDITAIFFQVLPVQQQLQTPLFPTTQPPQNKWANPLSGM